jgi:hypothetical protein
MKNYAGNAPVVDRSGICAVHAVTMRGVVLVAGELKTPSEWGIIDGVELLKVEGYQVKKLTPPDTPITFEQWTELVLSSYAFRIVR